MWSKLETSCLDLTFVGRIHTKLLARSNVVTIYSATPLQYLPFTPALQPCVVHKGRKRQLQEYGCYYTSLPKSPWTAECWWLCPLYVLRNFDQLFPLSHIMQQKTTFWIFLDSVLFLDEVNEIWENYQVDS